MTTMLLEQGIPEHPHNNKRYDMYVESAWHGCDISISRSSKCTFCYEEM